MNYSLVKSKGSSVLSLCKLQQHKPNSLAEERNVSVYDVNVFGGFTVTKDPGTIENASIHKPCPSPVPIFIHHLGSSYQTTCPCLT